MLKHSIIYLLGQTHNFNYLVDDGTITASPSRPLKRDNNPIISLVVKPFYCSQSLIPGCHTPGEKVRINVQSKIFQLDISGKVKFENIVFDGSDTFLNCDQCSYCRAVYYEDDFYTDDKGKSIDEGLFVPQKSCDEFASVSFFSLESTGILTLKSVNFQNFRQQYKALIYNQGGILNLYDVNFYNFMSKPKSGAIVSVPCSNSYCGEIHYINGSIQLLNNGYEITDEIDLSSFMKLNMLRWLEIDGITAKYNIVHKQTSDSDNRSMFELSKVLNISVINSKFDHNYAYNGLFYIDQKEMSMPTEINSQRQLIYHNLKNVIFESNSFKNNSAHTTAILNVEYNKDLQNVLMSQNLFLNNVGTSSGLIIFSNKGHLKNEYITGENRLIRLVGTSRTLVSFPSRTLTFSSNNFTQNSYDDDALNINNFANVVINGNS